MAKVVPTKPLLIMLYGFPGAGKSYFARQLCENLQAAHIQGERLRAELFEKPRYDSQENAIVNQLSEYMLGEFLNVGVSVVYDMNAMRTSQRHALRQLARQLHAQPLLVWLQIDADSAYVRASKRDKRRIDDRFSQPVSAASFEQIIGHMQNPTATEDFVVMSGKRPFATQLSAVMKRLHELKLIGSDDISEKVVKPGMVNLVPNPAAGRVDLSRRNIVIR